MTPEQHIYEGAKILSSYLEPLGFKFEFKEAGRGAGGHFAYGHFIKKRRFFGKTKRIEFHFRWSLGLVAYFINDLALSHQDYIDLVGKHGQNKYPNFSDDPQDSFHCLLWDLQNLLNDFAENDARVFRQNEAEIRHRAGISKKAYNRWVSGDQRLIELARAEFRKGNYLKVDELRQQLRYPELLSATEKKLFELNDKRKNNSGQR